MSNFTSATFVPAEEFDIPAVAAAGLDTPSVRYAPEIVFVHPDGSSASLPEVLRGVTIPSDEGEHRGRLFLDPPRSVEAGSATVGVGAIDWVATVGHGKFGFSVGDASAVLSLIFQTIDGSIDRALAEQDLERWTFGDDGEATRRPSTG